MTPSQLIRKSVIDRCKGLNYDHQVTLDSADHAVKMFKSGNFVNAAKLVDEAVVRAKSLSKKGKR